MQDISKSFIIIDALDECHDIDAVVSWLQNLAAVSAPTVSFHVLFSSRNMPTFSDEIRRIPHATILVNECTATDIELFIEESVMASHLRRMPSRIQEIVKDSLYKGADGM